MKFKYYLNEAAYPCKFQILHDGKSSQEPTTFVNTSVELYDLIYNDAYSWDDNYPDEVSQLKSLAKSTKKCRSVDDLINILRDYAKLCKQKLELKIIPA